MLGRNTFGRASVEPSVLETSRCILVMMGSARLAMTIARLVSMKQMFALLVTSHKSLMSLILSVKISVLKVYLLRKETSVLLATSYVLPVQQMIRILV
jgi:hypothetical protein